MKQIDKVVVKCKNCNGNFEVRPLIIKQGRGKYCSRKCLYQYMSRLSEEGNHPNFKGGKYIDYRGYYHVRSNKHPYAVNGYVREHRLVMEKFIGRYLLPTEVVDHVNGNKQDNRLENLKLIKSQAEHVRLETERGKYKGSHDNQLRNERGVYI